MNPPPWPNSKTQMPFESKGASEIPRAGVSRPLPSLPIAFSVAGILTLRAAMGRVCSGAVPPATSSVYLVPASLLAWSSFLEQEDFRLP